MKKTNFILLMLMFLVLTGCSKLNLTPVTSPPTGVHHQGKFVWHDLLTSDVAAARNFYGDLFGWSFRDQGNYTVVLNNDQAIGGIVNVRPKDNKEHAARWLASLSVPDVDQAAAFVKKSGGIIHEGPVAMKNRGRGLLISDPQGAQVILLHSLSGDPADTETAIGSWLWIELWSKTPEDSVAFYEEIGDYDAVKGENEYWFLWHDEWRAGIRQLPFDSMEVRWTPAIRVADTKLIADRAKELGGRVLVQPKKLSIGGSVTLIEDPNGGLVIAQHWPKQISAGE
ncbi:MAG: VOC family protein [Pseudomonadota bacterium]|nr:VOC family protein [Pseudomonadota bacterium]